MQKHRLFWCCIISLLLFGLVPFRSVFAQPNSHAIQFERIGGREGLPNSYLKNMGQDSRGFLWLSTYGSLARFDGHRFKVYKSDFSGTDGLSNNFIEKCVEDRTGIVEGVRGGGEFAIGGVMDMKSLLAS